MALDELILRSESGIDREAVTRVNEAAFGRPTQARLVDALRENNAVALSSSQAFCDKLHDPNPALLSFRRSRQPDGDGETSTARRC